VVRYALVWEGLAKLVTPNDATLDDRPSVTTNNPTPTIAGTSDVAPGTVVRVIAGSSLQAIRSR
jgi:hypothetical protein